MKQNSLCYILLLLVSLMLVPSCTGEGWSAEEKQLINQANYSRMRVTTIDNPCDSIVLRATSRPLSKKQLRTPEFGRLVASMIESVNDPNNEGVGIAAPQVGVGVQLVVVQRFDKLGTPFEVYVNPEIVSRSSEQVLSSEGCLSVPNRRGELLRHEKVEIGYRDAVTFEPRREWVEGFSAIIFQHEIDHLTGTLYIDYLN